MCAGRGLEASFQGQEWTCPTRVVSCFGRQRTVSVESRLEAVHILVQERWGAIAGFRGGEEGSFRKGTVAVVAQGGIGFSPG